MDAALIEKLDAGRNFSKKAMRALCYAPFASLYFDIVGNVRACCHNYTHVAGNIREQGIDEIWSGVKLAILRAALAGYAFGPGCGFCAARVADGVLENLSFKAFDRFDIESMTPEWPRQIEFSISNVCNLECVMCRGQWSSAIRRRREKLPPVQRLYGLAFFESLRKYLPHLRQMKFLGGEPLLIREYFTLWDMMITDGFSVPGHVTTNGTQYNKRVARVMEHVPLGFAVSLDGATKATVEAIRVNATFEMLMRNIAVFRAYTRERKTSFSLTFCLMRQNWHEFGEFCLMADAWDCPVGINTVTAPAEFGVYTLPVEELRKIVAAMERQAASLDGQLKRNHSVWFGELERMRRRCKRVS